MYQKETTEVANPFVSGDIILDGDEDAQVIVCNSQSGETISIFLPVHLLSRTTLFQNGCYHLGYKHKKVILRREVQKKLVWNKPDVA